MRNAETILNIIRKRGQRGLPVQDVYRLLYQRDLYLRAYGKLYRNKGAMTEGVTPETVDGMSLEKIETIINLLRNERYRWTPVRRIFIPKKKGKTKLRPLGLPSWSDKLLQEVIRSILEAYYEPQFSDHSHGFRPKRGCHTALREVMQKGKGTKWFIEGDLCACFDKIDHSILLNILQESFHDNRFTRLLSGLLKAGYLEDWKFNNTFSGAAQGSVAGPIFSNIVLNRLDKYVEEQIIPVYTRGSRRKTNPPYVRLTMQATEARRKNDWERVHRLNQQAQSMPSRDPNDPNFRRLWYVRYADDFLLGLIGPKNEAMVIKQKISEFLSRDLKLELNAEKTLVTHARNQKAKFLGYEIHALYDNSKHDHRGQRCINGSIGLRIPHKVKQEKCAKYMKHGKPKHIPQRIIDEAYSTVSQYQAEYRGIVQYYRMAYNLHTLNKLKYVMEVSLVQTLANKYKTTCPKIYKRYGAKIMTEEGERKVLLVKVERTAPKKPLIAHFGGVSLKWNKWVSVNDNLTEPIWSKRSEVVQRLLAQECELCGSHKNIEMHHIRKLTDLKQSGRTAQPEWKRRMSARRRKSLAVCQTCHQDIHYGKYDGRKLSA
ncbi:MAG: maturase [Alphaproteobacteria bacterium]|nr:maturase [Alphaproteobacteria bacterium]